MLGLQIMIREENDPCSQPPWNEIDPAVPRPDGAMSFPPLEGVDWKDGYFIVSANAELSDNGEGFVGGPAPLPEGAVDRLIEAALAAFTSVEEPACDAESIRHFYTRIDPNAYDFGDPNGTGAPHMVIYLGNGNVHVLCGNFGDEVDPENSIMPQLRTAIFGTYDINYNLWVETENFGNNHIGIWVSPASGPVPPLEQ